MRLIDADALQEALTRKKAGIANKRWTEGFNAAISKAKSMVSCAKTIDAEPVRKAMNEWISVNDRLPDDDEIVIVFKKMVSEDNNVLLVFKTVDTEYDDLESVKLMRGYMVKLLIQCKGSRISHWMPLPEPPNEE